MDDVSQRPTVFIVDDDEGGRDSLSYLIKSIGIDVEAYGSPIDFLDSFDGSRPGCLVLDVRMPQMGGLDLLKAVRERGIDTPAIMISAFGDVPMAINAMKNGAVDFLTKPFNDQELLDRIQQGIDDDFHQRKLGSEITEIRVRFEKLTTREREVLARPDGGQAKQADRPRDGDQPQNPLKPIAPSLWKKLVLSRWLIYCGWLQRWSSRPYSSRRRRGTICWISSTRPCPCRHRRWPASGCCRSFR